MATYGFLDVLQEELDKNFPFDYEISWDKRNHAVEVSFLLEAQNAAGVEMLDEDGEVSSDDILFEEAVLFYNPAKSTVNAEDYLTVIPYLPCLLYTSATPFASVYVSTIFTFSFF